MVKPAICDIRSHMLHIMRRPVDPHARPPGDVQHLRQPVRRRHPAGSGLQDNGPTSETTQSGPEVGFRSLAGDALVPAM